MLGDLLDDLLDDLLGAGLGRSVEVLWSGLVHLLLLLYYEQSLVSDIGRRSPHESRL